jgi:CHASE2 domain-containing sensor protein
MAMPFSFMKIVRPFTRKGWGHWLLFFLLLAAAGYAGHLLSSIRALTGIRYSIYHRQLMMRDRSQLYPKRTALVLLNDADYWGKSFQARTPLKRGELAELIKILQAVGVNTIALDVDLRSPHPDDTDHPEFEFDDYKKEDAQLVAAIHGMCEAGRHVVLSSSVRFGTDGYEKMPSIYTQFMDQMPCVTPGYIQLPFDMRRVPGTLEITNGPPLDSMSLAVTGIADPAAHDVAGKNEGHGFRFSEYLTEAEFGPKNGRQFIFNGQQITNMKIDALRTQLADKLVFIGAEWHSTACGTGPLVDQHNSPGGMEPGAMLHANYVEAMLDRTGTFTPLSDSTAELIEIGLALALAMIGVLEIHSAWKWAAFGFGIVFSILFTYTLLQNLGLFLDFFVPMLMIIVHTLVEEGIKIWHKSRHPNCSAIKKPDAIETAGQP